MNDKVRIKNSPDGHPSKDASSFPEDDLPPLADDILDSDGQIAERAIDYLDDFESDDRGPGSGSPPLTTTVLSADADDLAVYESSFIDEGHEELTEIFSDIDNIDDSVSWIDGAVSQIGALEMPQLEISDESLFADDAGLDGPLEDDPVLIDEPETNLITDDAEAAEETEDTARVMQRLGLHIDEDPPD